MRHSDQLTGQTPQGGNISHNSSQYSNQGANDSLSMNVNDISAYRMSNNLLNTPMGDKSFLTPGKSISPIGLQSPYIMDMENPTTPIPSHPSTILTSLSAKQISLLVTGAMFMKLNHNRILGLNRLGFGGSSLTRNIRYICISHDLKYLKWKNLALMNNVQGLINKGEDGFHYGDVSALNNFNSPVPMKHSKHENIDKDGAAAAQDISSYSAASSYMPLSKIESVSLVDNTSTHAEHPKFALWQGHHSEHGHSSDISSASSPLLVIKGRDGEKSLHLQFYCSASSTPSSSNSQSNDDSTAVITQWYNALSLVLQDVKENALREAEDAANGASMGDTSHVDKGSIVPMNTSVLLGSTPVKSVDESKGINTLPSTTTVKQELGKKKMSYKDYILGRKSY